MSIFGKTSKKHMEKIHMDLKLILNKAIETCPVDFGVHDGGRTFNKQLEYFLNGKSQLDPRIPSKLARAMHVITKERPLAMAVDIHISETYKGKSLTWNSLHLTAVAFYLIAVADILFNDGIITHRIRWGGNWDMDGIIQLDQNFDDNPHLELYKP